MGHVVVNSMYNLLRQPTFHNCLPNELVLFGKEFQESQEFHYISNLGRYIFEFKLFSEYFLGENTYYRIFTRDCTTKHFKCKLSVRISSRLEFKVGHPN